MLGQESQKLKMEQDAKVTKVKDSERKISKDELQVHKKDSNMEGGEK